MAEDRFTELLSKKLAGEISSDELRDFNQLISSNAAFRQEYESLKAYWKQDILPYDNIGEIFENIKIKTGITTIEDPKVKALAQKNKNYGWIKLVAAAILLLLISAVTYQLFLSKYFFSKGTELVWKELKTPSGLTHKIKLADGTLVTLNAETTLKFPAEFNGKLREVFLTGEAYFDVAKDHAHPFIVHTSKMNIRVVGTAFDIKAYENDYTQETTLLRGSIQVTFVNSSSAPVFLKPKDKIILNNSGYHLTFETFTNEDNTLIETAWINNKLAFKNQPFNLLANSLSRKYGIKIIFENQSLKNLKFTGEFEKEKLNQALLSLQIVTPFHYKMQGSDVHVY